MNIEEQRSLEGQGSYFDASVLDDMDVCNAVREDIKQNRVEYIFPEGLSRVDIFEECRALTKLDDFETMFDYTMSALHGKPVVIQMRNDDGSRSELCKFQVVDRYMDLHGIDMIHKYPILVAWLTQFMAASISKKFPVPGQSQPQVQGTGNKRSKKVQKRQKGRAAVS